jgi:polysaccharide export outer membrane protein
MMQALLWTGLAILVSTCGASLAASQQESAGGGAAVAPGGTAQQALRAEETLISPNDLLFIQVFDVDQMTREYRVSGAGMLDFPLLPEPVPVAGLTPQQAAAVISERCIKAGVLSRPQISVTVRESRLHAVAVVGAVKNPQIYPVFGRIALLDILTLAGGVADDAGSTVTITRGEDSRRVLAAEAGSAGGAEKSPSVSPTVTINLQRLLENGDPSLNVNVYPGDRVTVQRAGIVFVLGAVNRAGGYLLSEAHQNMTVLKALAFAGDLKSTAKAKKTIILRPNPSAPNGREQIPIDLHAMLKGSAPDRSLLSNDILFVPDSTALKALHRGADIAGMAAAYAAVYTVAP